MTLAHRFVEGMRYTILGQDQGQAGGDDLVPAEVTWSQILDYVNGSGDTSAIGSYGVGLPGIRNAALGYSTFYRCTTLLSSLIAQVVTQGSLRILDSDGRVSHSPESRSILEIFSTSPDGDLPAYQWVEDWAADYLIDGNALAHVLMSPSGQLRNLRRMRSWDAQTIRANNGSLVYRGHYVDQDQGSHTYVPASQVAHSRWPRLLRHVSYGGTGRHLFAQAPVVAMRPALEIGMAGDRYIREWYTQGGAHRSQVAIGLRERLNPEQRDQLRKYLKSYATSNTREPLVMGGGATFQPLFQNAQNREQAALRQFQVNELARVYGIPGPVINENVTQWGSGIEQLAKLLWRFGARQHIDRMMSPVARLVLQQGQRFDYDPSDILRGDADSVSQLINATRGDAQRPEDSTREERRLWAGLPLEPENGTLREMPTPPTPPADGGTDPNETDG